MIDKSMNGMNCELIRRAKFSILKNKMRMLSRNPELNGLNLFTYNNLEEVRRRGYHVMIACRDTKDLMDAGRIPFYGTIVTGPVDQARAQLAKKIGDEPDKKGRWDFFLTANIRHLFSAMSYAANPTVSNAKLLNMSVLNLKYATLPEIMIKEQLLCERTDNKYTVTISFYEEESNSVIKGVINQVDKMSHRVVNKVKEPYGTQVVAECSLEQYNEIKSTVDGGIAKVDINGLKCEKPFYNSWCIFNGVVC